MFENFVSTLQFLLSFVAGFAVAPDPGALALAVAVVAAVVVLAVALAIVLPSPEVVAGPHPRRAIDVSSPLAQSDPDAAGHPRPRAPQIADRAA